jgi:hypothetical protein
MRIDDRQPTVDEQRAPVRRAVFARAIGTAMREGIAERVGDAPIVGAGRVEPDHSGDAAHGW